MKGEPSPPELINRLARLALSLGGLEQRKMIQRIVDGALGELLERARCYTGSSCLRAGSSFRFRCIQCCQNSFI
jgi:hypothetical protein